MFCCQPASNKWGSPGRAVFDAESFFEELAKFEQLLLGRSKKFGGQKLPSRFLG
jgi:hypothetical protein